MAEQPAFDFRIQKLGEPSIASPMHLSHVDGDFISDFVTDSERILHDHSLDAVVKCCQAGKTPASFEKAGPRDTIFFDPQQSKAAVVTCGGLCPGLNDVIRGLVRCLWHNYGVREIYGIPYGYRGLNDQLGHEPVMLTPDVVEYIPSTAGTILGSSRGPQPVSDMVDYLARRGINMLFTIGGDGTQRGAQTLVEEIERRGLQIAVVGIPKTIDNDIMFVERSFGFDTAFSIATQVISSAHAEAIGALNGVTIVKLMGRNSGFLAACSAVASGDVNFCLVPEVPFDLDPPHGFLTALEKRLERRKHAVVVVAEGAGARFVESQRDASGNIKPGDIGSYLYDRAKAYLEERNLPASVRYIDPSYIVRSQEATATDRLYCLRLAYNAVHAAMSGRTSMIVGHWHTAFTHVPIAEAVSQRKAIDPEGPLWLSVLETTDQPNRMVNA